MSALCKNKTWIGNNPVSVITGHKSLDGWVSEHFDTPSGPRGRRGRWGETFSKFNLSILYVQGKALDCRCKVKTVLLNSIKSTQLNTIDFN